MTISSLRLLHLADSALPIGSLSHSFGLETMVEEQGLKARDLFGYLHELLEETLHLEAVFCRAAHGCGPGDERLVELTELLSAMRPARESRQASLALGKRFAGLVSDFERSSALAYLAEQEEVHFAVAFGFACGALGVNADDCVAAFLHQNILSAISTAQRLMPLGQRQANRLAWSLKAAILAAAERSRIEPERAFCFAHLPELASMRHPNLFTRLFIS
jgi:urease accessory protein